LVQSFFLIMMIGHAYQRGMMELRQLRYFLAVADTCHFRRAAESLHVSQPTLSQQIQQLEKELGTPLFDRIGKRVQLTVAGETFLHHAQRVLHELEQAQVALRELDGLERGKLCVGAVQTLNTYLIPPIIARFATAHPAVFLSVEELTASQIEQGLLRGPLNLGISFVSPATGEIASEPLFEEELVLIVPARHRLAKRAVLKVKELDAEPLVLLPTAFYPRQLFDEKAREVGAHPRVAVEMNSIEGILAAIRTSGGATVLPALALTKKDSGLRAIRLTEPTPRRTVGLLWRRDGYRCRATNAFMKYAHAVVEENATVRPPPKRGPQWLDTYPRSQS
jgi:LysR family cyn operon transcriptional activator